MEEKQIHERLKIFIKKIGKTQKEIYEELNFHKNTAQRYFSGKAQPGANFLRMMHKKYGANINWILNGRGEMFDLSPLKPVIHDVQVSYPVPDDEGYLSEREMEDVGRLIRIMKRRKSVGRIVATLVEVNEEER